MTKYVVMINLISDQDVEPQGTMVANDFATAKNLAFNKIHHDRQLATAHPQPEDPVYEIYEHNGNDTYRCDLMMTAGGAHFIVENAVVAPIME